MKRDSRDNFSDGPASKIQRGGDLSNVQLRFLIPGRAAGIIIGKGGENIKHIRSQYNAKLNIPDSRGPERIFTLEGDLMSCCEIMRELLGKLKDIMNAKLSDPKRIMGNQGRGRRNQEEDDKPEEEDGCVDLRLLVHQSQAGSVIGRGGERIKELRDSAPPRGPRDNYDANNFSEADALSYGGWLSREAQRMISQGMQLGPPPSMHGGPPPPGSMMMPPGSMGMGGQMGAPPPNMPPMMGSGGAGSRGGRAGSRGGGVTGGVSGRYGGSGGGAGGRGGSSRGSVGGMSDVGTTGYGAVGAGVGVGGGGYDVSGMMPTNMYAVQDQLGVAGQYGSQVAAGGYGAGNGYVAAPAYGQSSQQVGRGAYGTQPAMGQADDKMSTWFNDWS